MRGPGYITKTKRNPKDGAEMIWIPPGDFLMGDNDLMEPDEGRMATNAPRHTIYLKGYWIYKTPVTRAQYRKFCTKTGHEMPNKSWLWEEKEDQPIVEVTWDDARDYCNWAGVRLPTEAQWEKAARGTDGRRYPWGNLWDPGKCKWKGSTMSPPAPVGSYPQGASPYGVLDMAGNVWQWCSDWYSPDYYKTSPRHDPTGPKTGQYHTLRGGCRLFDDEGFFRSAYRYYFVTPLLTRYGVNGFRCVSE